MMRILVLYPYIPYPTDRGTYQRSYHLVRALGRSHDVDLLCMAEGGKRIANLNHFRGFCRRVEAIPFEHPPWPRLARRVLDSLPSSIRHWEIPRVHSGVDAFIEGRGYDLIHVSDIVLLPYVMDRGLEVPVSVDRNRVDYEFQLAKLRVSRSPPSKKLSDVENLWKLRRFEKKAARSVSMEVVCADHDKEFIRRKISPDVPVIVVGNGVDLDYFSPGAAPVERAASPTLLFCGTLDYVANVDGLLWFFETIYPQLRSRIENVELHIVGRKPVDKVVALGAEPGVTVTADPLDVRPFYRRSWLQVVPLRIGSGSRLKIPESLAMGTPVVSTHSGARGLNLVHGKNILLADTPEAFAGETERALRNAELRARVEAEGLKAAQEFSWHHFGEQLSSTYERRFAQVKNVG